MRRIALLFSVLCLLLAGCGRTTGQIPSDPPQGSSAADQAPQETASGTAQSEIFPDDEIPGSSKPSGGSLPADTEIDRDAALALAMENAGVPEKDAYNMRVERDRENDIPIFQVEFETEHGNYDFEIAITGGKIIGADNEVDEEWLDRLGGSPVAPEEAKQVVQSRAPASSTENIRMWEESDDGRGRFERELYHDGIKYEFEINPATGIIFGWNVDLRE